MLALGAIGKVLYSRFNKPEPKTVQHGKTVVGHVVNVNAPVTGNLSIGDGLVSQPAPKGETPSNPSAVSPTPPKRSIITAKEIHNAIVSAPLFRQDEVGEFYKGQSIDWDCRLFSIHKREDGETVGLDLNCEGKDMLRIWCVVRLSDYPQLKVLPNNIPLRIMGTVATAEPYSISIKDAKLFF